MDALTDADGRPQLRIRNGVDTSMTIGDRPMVNDLSYRPWEVSAAAIAALRKELSPNTEQIVLALPPVINMRVVGRTRVQLEKPTPRAKAQSPARLTEVTEDQIQTLMGDVSELSDLQKKIRRYAVLKHGARWRDIDPAKVQKGARDDELYKKEVGVIVHHITTFRRGLGRKE